MTDINVTTKITAYTVSCLPEESIDSPAWDLKVEYADHGRWAIRHMGKCLSVSGSWSYEPIPSSREDDWLAEHRFEDVDAALEMAQKIAPTVRINGLIPADLLARSS